MSQTHWKKNNDSKYISGEDLNAELNGLKKEMDVEVVAFEDVKTYDQNQNEKITKTGLYLKEVGGQQLYKPLILNNTNAKVLAKVANSPIMEDWIGQKVTLFAKADSRFDWVARLKKYVEKNTTNPKPALEKLGKCKDLKSLQEAWTKLKPNEQSLPEVLAKKEELKGKLK